jgi:hypothetical protein
MAKSQPRVLTKEYWSHFALTAEELDFLHRFILEAGIPQTATFLAYDLVERRCEQEEAHVKEQVVEVLPYDPRHDYKVGQQYVRPGLHPVRDAGRTAGSGREKPGGAGAGALRGRVAAAAGGGERTGDTLPGFAAGGAVRQLGGSGGGAGGSLRRRDGAGSACAYHRALKPARTIADLAATADGLA